MALSLYRSVAWNCYDGVAAGGRFSGCSLTGRNQLCPCHRNSRFRMASSRERFTTYSSRTVRDVQLFVRHTWLWDDERHPGKIDPGTSTFHTLQQEIPPGGTARFNLTQSPPLAKTAGGHFVTTVSIAGFTEVIPQVR